MGTNAITFAWIPWSYIMSSIRLRFTAALLGVLISVPGAAAQDATKLPSFLTSHMVLQRDVSNRIWGWDKPGTVVTVSVGPDSRQAAAAADGAWSVQLPPMRAGGPIEINIQGTTSIKLEDVLIGDVWMCSGQSNMEWSVAQSANAQEEIAAGNQPRIRHCKFQHVPSDKPQSDVATGGWKVASPETIGEFTAVGYYFAKNLQAEIDVPIGLIGCNWGGTRIEPWTPPIGFQQVPALKEIADKLEQFPTKNEKGEINVGSPMAIYNGMVHPLLPATIKGVIWYQGESNVGEGMLYHEKMKALIGGWRTVWNNPDLPFYYVQLAPFRYGDPNGLPELWEAQTASLSIPSSGMAVTTDIGNVADIHPANKQDVGRRLALWALVQTYGRTQFVSSGPLFASAAVDGSRIRIRFHYAGAGLQTRDGQAPTGFEIAGADGAFVPADAAIEADSIVVSSASIAAPAKVRFAWNQEANPNLMNPAGLPAVPFRWPPPTK
jgi:sialate O-acetylesterase